MYRFVSFVYRCSVSSVNLLLFIGSSKNQEMHAMNMEAIVHDDMVCLLCLQIPKEWFVIEACGCRFCLQVSFKV